MLISSPSKWRWLAGFVGAFSGDCHVTAPSGIGDGSRYESGSRYQTCRRNVAVGYEKAAHRSLSSRFPLPATIPQGPTAWDFCLYFFALLIRNLLTNSETA